MSVGDICLRLVPPKAGTFSSSEDKMSMIESDGEAVPPEDFCPGAEDE